MCFGHLSEDDARGLPFLLKRFAGKGPVGTFRPVFAVPTAQPRICGGTTCFSTALYKASNASIASEVCRLLNKKYSTVEEGRVRFEVARDSRLELSILDEQVARVEKFGRLAENELYFQQLPSGQYRLGEYWSSAERFEIECLSGRPKRQAPASRLSKGLWLLKIHRLTKSKEGLPKTWKALAKQLGRHPGTISRLAQNPQVRDLLRSHHFKPLIDASSMSGGKKRQRSSTITSQRIAEEQ